MDKYVLSSDKLKIHYNISGNHEIALVFVHGWLGSAMWWDNQIEYFKDNYTVVSIDLAGHGKSERARFEWSDKQYADDINAVIDQLNNKEVILIGHSMAGAFILQTSLSSNKVKALIVVDTLKDMERLLTYKQADEMLFSNYRRDFKESVEQLLPKFLFCASTPQHVVERLKNEFLSYDPLFAIELIEPLYKMQIKNVASMIKVPVRAINSCFTPTNIEANQKYFKNYNCVLLENTGHYPMLEDASQFNNKLELLLSELK